MLKTTLNKWKHRQLSIKGKLTELNNLALVPLIYVISVINTPQTSYYRNKHHNKNIYMG